MSLGLGAILAAAERGEGRIAIDAPEGWMQGRTAYGGVSTALAHEAARSLAPGLPPLRSAQVSFIGPLSGRLETSAAVLRRGRSTAFVQADVKGEGGLGLRAMLVFTVERDSQLRFDRMPAPPAPDPEVAAEASAISSSATRWRRRMRRRTPSICGGHACARPKGWTPPPRCWPAPMLCRPQPWR